MSRIQALDEITDQLGPPAFLRWVDAPHGGTAAVVRFRHRGALINISPSGNFRLIFHLSSSQIVRQNGAQPPSQDGMPIGSIAASFTQQPERIRVLSAADTLHLLFSPELAKSCGADQSKPLCPPAYHVLQAAAVQALVATALDGPDSQLERAVATIGNAVTSRKPDDSFSSGGLSPHASCAVHQLLEQHLNRGIPVPDLAYAAGLSLHHFIKTFRRTEGFTPHALLLQRRIEQAISLLLTRKQSVGEIGFVTGFSSPSHFISTFRKLVGVTPASLRRAAAR